MLQLSTKSSSEVAVNRSTKGNILIKDELLNKYKFIKDLFDNETVDNYEVIVDYISNKLTNINPSNIKIEDIKKLAYEIFSQNHLTRYGVDYH